MERIAIFEPWTLGDTVVALILAKGLASEGRSIAFVCDREWEGWIGSQAYIAQTIPFSVPWTAQRRKYHVKSYLDLDIGTLKKRLRKHRTELLIDVRGDIRHYLFLKTLNVARVLSPFLRLERNVYKRPARIGRILGVHDSAFEIPSPRTSNPQPIMSVSCFFGASWPNRRVPFDKAAEISTALASEGYRIKVILPPDESILRWSSLVSSLPGQSAVVQGPVIRVVDAIRGSDCCISTDSGWLHVSSFLGIHTIGLFAFDTAQEWAPPYTQVLTVQNLLPAKLRYSQKAINQRPLAELNVEQVLQAVRSIEKGITDIGSVQIGQG